MHSITTDILTLDEFAERRKIGRTTIFERLRSGYYQEHIDFTCDGKEKKFFWPPQEFVKRDMLLRNMFISITTEAKSAPGANQPPQNQQSPEKNIHLPTEPAEDMILPKNSRRKPTSPNKSGSSLNRPAFNI